MDRLTTGYVSYKYQTGNNNEWGDVRPRRARAGPGSGRRRRRRGGRTRWWRRKGKELEAWITRLSGSLAEIGNGRRVGRDEPPKSVFL